MHAHWKRIVTGDVRFASEMIMNYFRKMLSVSESIITAAKLNSSKTNDDTNFQLLLRM